VLAQAVLAQAVLAQAMLARDLAGQQRPIPAPGQAAAWAQVRR
jgi:hypothetical protein